MKKTYLLLLCAVMLLCIACSAALADGSIYTSALNGNAQTPVTFTVSSTGSATLTLHQNGKGTLNQTSNWDGSRRFSQVWGMYTVDYSSSYENGSVVFKDENCTLTLRYSGTYTITVTPYSISELNAAFSADRTTTNWMYNSTSWSSVPSWSISTATRCTYYSGGYTAPTATPQRTVTAIPSYASPVLSISNTVYPTSITYGNAFSLGGTITASAGRVTKVTGEILNSWGTAIRTINIYPYSASCNLSYYPSFSRDLYFDQLTPGYYTFRLTATALNGTQSTTATLIQTSFTVSAQVTAVPVTPTPVPVDRTPVLSIYNQNYPTNLAKGLTFYLRGTIKTDVGQITRVVGEIYDYYGNRIKTFTVYPYQNSYSLENYSGFSTSLGFSSLSVGTYTYKLSATAVNGSKTTTTTLVQAGFNVYNNVTQAPITAAPITAAPITAPPTVAPITAAPITAAPVTAPPTPTPSVPTPVISASQLNAPGNLEKGSGFTPAGTVSCDIGQLTWLSVSVTNSSGSLVLSTTVYPNTAYCTLGSFSEITSLPFSALDSGNYTYQVTAGAQYDTQQTSRSLLQRSFYVYQSVQPSGDKVVVHPTGYDTQFKVGTANNADNEDRLRTMYRMLDDDVTTNFTWTIWNSERKDDIPEFTFTFDSATLSAIGIRNGYLQGSWDRYEQSARLYRIKAVITDASGNTYTETLNIYDTYDKTYRSLNFSRTYTNVISINLFDDGIKVGKNDEKYICYITDICFYQ